MPLANTRRTGLVDQVIEQLRAMIGTEWPVGTRIPPEHDLTERLGVGRNTVREAVKALVHTGLLEVRQGDGSYVRATSEISGALRRLAGDELADVAHVRRLLETEGARLAAANRSPEDLARLDAAMVACGEAEASGDLAAFVAADLHFHQSVLHSARNPVLSELYRGLSEVVRASLASRISSEPRDGCETRRHTELLEAIHRGDADAAAAEARVAVDRPAGASDDSTIDDVPTNSDRTA